MKYKEIREDQPDNKKQKSAKQKKPKKSKFNWKATVVEAAPKDNIAKKTKEEADLLRTEAFAATKTLWKSYALLIANYFHDAYTRNFDYLYEKLKEIDSKPKLNDQDIHEMQIIVSINKLKYYVQEDTFHNTIDINTELIERDFFKQDFEQEYYQEMIAESDTKFHYSISYLIRTYNLLISFVKEKQLRQILYRAIVIDLPKSKRSRKDPIVLTEALMKRMPIHDYLDTDFKKREPYKYVKNNLKRAYEAPDKADGKRFLVDRLWPRGISKEKADLTGGWLKDIAPSNELREWFGHVDDKFPEFEKKYKEELKGSLQQQALATLKAAANKGTVTLVYGAKNELHNNAVVIKDVLLGK